MAENIANNVTVAKKETLAQEWNRLNNKRTDILRRCEDYAMWTLPYIFPISGSRYTELNQPVDSTGAMAVNHLSNKLVMTLFQPSQPFFRLMVTDDVLEEYVELAKNGDDDAIAVLNAVDKEMARAEKQAMKELDYNRYRTEATMTAKNLVVTGNGLLYHPEEGKVQSYSLRDYVVERDLSGTLINIITRDKKAFNTFSEKVQGVLRQSNNRKYNKDNCDVVLYTQVKLEEDGKFHLTQYADDIKLDSEGSWPLEDLPWIPLTWNLVRGEDYGRGLVEDYAGSFHALYVLSNAMMDAVGIAADIKFLVNPASVVDVKELNDSPSGSYHSGVKEDIWALELGKFMDLQLVENAIARLITQISKAFLLNSSVQRDAERVTAEEIRYVAQELEMSHGGIYSRFAEEWQYRTAVLMLKKVKVTIGKGETVYPQIITGLDSLSRAGDLDNLRLFVADMQMLKELPDQMLQVIDMAKFASYVGIRRGVDYEKFIKGTGQLQQEAQAQAQANEEALVQEAGVKAAGEGVKQAMKQTEE